ncbi:MAG: Cna protein B-type domain protein [Firmicutes bacterium ADurb.BinA205]|nr:MAG: Cna protein B-type domain protein [Firmicutes bacterium ADurb.BinA205]
MKKTRRIAAMVAAMALAATMMVPAAMMTASAADITITGVGSEEHTFEVYQIMTGTYDSTEGTFSQLKWANGIATYGGTSVTAGTDVPDSVLTTLTTSGFDARTLVTGSTPLITLGTKLKNVKSASGSAAITGLTDGYYVIKDVTDLENENDANSAWIIDIAGPASKNIAIKNAKPTVDKQVQDEAEDAEVGADAQGYGESADHAINESFNFKLTASIPADSDLTSYSSYAIKFNDTMSNGVTYESVSSVKVKSGSNETVVLPYSATPETGVSSADGYKLDVATGGGSFTLQIDDIKALLPASTTWGTDAITVEVVYAAHLNENAVIDPQSRTNGTSADTNNNKVFLNYSNNPDATGAGATQPGGKTPDDYVWVFTYEVDNTKFKINDTAGNELEGATFDLYTGSDSSVTANKVSLIYDSTLGAYRPIKTGETATVMTSSAVAATKGQFNIVGLDAGVYTLHEVSAPSGYNTANDITFTITATHAEQSADPTKVDLSVTGISSAVENKVVDTKNSTLPSTGGMGTMLFLGIGGAVAAGAGITLISKKRSKDEDEQ